MSHHFEKARYLMVEQQVRPWGVLNETILNLMSELPREWFVPEHLQGLAYADTFIPIPEGQVLLPPCIVGRILQACSLKPMDRVLQIGSGTGYLTALLANMSQQVDVIEYHASLAHTTKSLMAHAKLKNVFVVEGDAMEPHRVNEQYEVIVLTGSVAHIPTFFRDALTDNGRLFAFTGQSPNMEAILYSKFDSKTESLFETDVQRLINAPEVERFTF